MNWNGPSAVERGLAAKSRPLDSARMSRSRKVSKWASGAPTRPVQADVISQRRPSRALREDASKQSRRNQAANTNTGTQSCKSPVSRLPVSDSVNAQADARSQLGIPE